MDNFLVVQADYIAFLESIGFFALGIFSFLISHREKDSMIRLPWFYLGLFGIFHGLEKWLQIISLSFGNSNLATIMRYEIGAISFIILFEFVRRGVEILYKKRISKLLYILLSIAFISILVLSPQIFQLVTKFFGLLVILSSGFLFYKFASLLPQRKKTLVLLGVIFVFYGFILGISIFSSLILLDLAEILISLSIFWVVWNYLDLSVIEEINLKENNHLGRNKKIFMMVFGTIVVIVLISFVLVWLGQNAQTEARRDIIANVETAAISIKPKDIKALSGTPKDRFNPAYDRLRNRLIAIHAVNNMYRFVNLTAYKNGQIVFLVDAEPENSKDYSPPGQVYKNPPSELRKVLSDGKNFTEGPFKDRWGTWVSGLVAIKDPNTNSVVAALEVDINAQQWLQHIFSHRLIVLALAFISFFMVIAVVAIRILWQREKYYKKVQEAKWESEERFRQLIENAPLGIITCDTEGNITATNPTMLSILGSPSEQETKMINLLTFPLMVKAGMSESIRKCMISGETVTSEHLYTSKWGKTLYGRLHLTPMRGSSREIIGVQGIVEDFTEHKRVEEELLKAEKIESIGILAGGMAHDFNNLLTIILGNISLAKIYVPENNVLQRLTEVETAAFQAKELTQQLLTFAKGGAPIMRISSIKKLIRDNVIFALRGSNIISKFSIQNNLWSVEIDKGQISQVINNLVINAKQALPDGGIIKVCASNILVAVGKSSFIKAGEYVLLVIADQGSGIPEEFRQRIFDPYFTTKQEGSGLGLATSYSIIKKHNGYIIAESELGVGTQISIYLPATRENMQVKTEYKDQSLVNQGKILIMDDEKIIREIAAKMLVKFGYEVTCAKDGDEALQLYQQAQDCGSGFDVVVMDLTIPGGMGGQETIKELLALDQNVKAIVSSGYSNDPVMAEYRKYGFSGVLAKPYTMELLGKIVLEVMLEKN